MTAPALAVLAPHALLAFLTDAIDEAEAAPPLQQELTEPFRKALDRAKEATREARAEIAKAPGATAVAAYANSGTRARGTANLVTMGRRILARAEAGSEKPNSFAVALAALTEAGELLARGAVTAAQPAGAAANYGLGFTGSTVKPHHPSSSARPRGRA